MQNQVSVALCLGIGSFTKWIFRLFSVGLFLLIAKPVFSEQTVPLERPNVLFILADDLGIGDLACYGNPKIDTPIIDSLAKQGIRFTSHYAPSPLCAPSRAGFLTGRYNHRTGAVDVPSNRGLDRIELSEKTFGDHFRGAGYATALIGKWHNGLYCRDYLPHQRGFDLFFGFANGGQDYWKWNLLRNDKAVPHDGRYLTDVLNDEAIEFIIGSTKAKKPFALFLAHHVPHSPFQAPEKLVRKYRDRLGKGVAGNVPTICAMIEAMDTGLGRLFEELEKFEIRNNTIVVFTSDNGAYVSGASRRFCGGLSGNKGDVGEQGILVPCIVSWPGVLPVDKVIDTPIHGCDWLPTLLQLAKVPAKERSKHFDGVDISSLLLGEQNDSLDQRSLFFQKNRYVPVAHSDAAIRKGHWKLVWPGIPMTMKKDSARDNPSYRRGIVRPHWEMPLDRELAEFSKLEDPRPKLFDLSKDSAERNDLAASFPEIVKELSEEYDAWFEEVDADWRRARKSILEHDKAYWRDRESPDVESLLKDFR